MNQRPPLHPAVAATRLAVRQALVERAGSRGDSVEMPLAIVALSGGADSLALAAAAAFVGPRCGWRVGAVIVDHALQAGSAGVAERAAVQARKLGLDPVVVALVSVEARELGPEAAARQARYRALEEHAAVSGASLILTAHTRDDQAEQVLLGIARGSGARSLAGIPPHRGLILRPFLGVTRVDTEAACEAQALEPWLDPHNEDDSYARVRVRHRVLPLLEAELGPGIAAALARTAEQAREDAAAFDEMVNELIEDVVEHAEAGISVSLAVLSSNPAALRHRLIRRVAEAEFGSELSREHTLAIAALVTNWRGQGPIYVPGIKVIRSRGSLLFTRQIGSPREAESS
ncbi:tRNA lysidine(34) synthetase TilS [Leucobacter coleopterorum]|uniref:tRNA(Ile)-lysidine synthase n=1 Tax=Leucobacter coleopterorum TaxID=2714933 RepID=A0ABX6K1P2_9MICO|nr:tRNA lysidine(34) synthetase TilS [Leucobacter coleopterorum]QIM19162.1 tRNA lysidine(34) synthetase TilS [Leucobacter coleopterorum]